MAKSYRVVYSFHSSRASAQKSLNIIKKKFPDAYIIEEGLTYIVELGNFYNRLEAEETIHKAVMAGYWGGIYKS